jgi:hypothetical protein
MTTSALRIIERAGGLDNYLLFTKDSKLGSEVGLKIKRQIILKWEQQNPGYQYNQSRLKFLQRMQGNILAPGKYFTHTLPPRSSLPANYFVGVPTMTRFQNVQAAQAKAAAQQQTIANSDATTLD